MKIVKNIAWVFYLSETKPEFDDNKDGKWMYFFDDKEFVSEICRKAVEDGIVAEAKHSNAETGVACFYLNCDDMAAHKRVIQFFLDNDLIKRTKTGKLYNISFKLNQQTLAGQYGEDFKAEIKLEQFIDLYTGTWKI